MKRDINLIVVHCSDSDNPKHDNIATVRQWHTERGFIGPDGLKGTHDDIGYHYFITKDGTVHTGRPEHRIGAHVGGFNKRSLGVCLSGRKQFTSDQFQALEKLLKDLCKKYDLEKKDIVEHNDLQPAKTCPNFDLHKLLSSWNWF